MPGPEKAYGLPLRLMKRVERAVLSFERGSEILPGRTARRRVDRCPQHPGRLWARSGAGGIPGRSGMTPASATVTLLDWDGTTLIDGETRVIFNGWLGVVGANKVISIQYGQGDWWVDGEECP